MTAWYCSNPWSCHNHTTHEWPRGCVHVAAWCADRHDLTEAVQS